MLLFELLDVFVPYRCRSNYALCVSVKRIHVAQRQLSMFYICTEIHLNLMTITCASHGRVDRAQNYEIKTMYILCIAFSLCRHTNDASYFWIESWKFFARHCAQSRMASCFVAYRSTRSGGRAGRGIKNKNCVSKYYYLEEGKKCATVLFVCQLASWLIINMHTWVVKVAMSTQFPATIF